MMEDEIVPDVPKDFDDVFSNSKQDEVPEDSKSVESEVEFLATIAPKLMSKATSSPNCTKVQATKSSKESTDINSLSTKPSHSSRSSSSNNEINICRHSSSKVTDDQAFAHRWFLDMCQHSKASAQNMIKEASELSYMHHRTLHTISSREPQKQKLVETHRSNLDRIISICRSICNHLKDVYTVAVGPVFNAYKGDILQESQLQPLHGQHCYLLEPHHHVDSCSQIVTLEQAHKCFLETIRKVTNLARTSRAIADDEDNEQSKSSSVEMRRIEGYANAIITYMNYAQTYVDDMNLIDSHGTASDLVPHHSTTLGLPPLRPSVNTSSANNAISIRSKNQEPPPNEIRSFYPQMSIKNTSMEISTNKIDETKFLSPLKSSQRKRRSAPMSVLPSPKLSPLRKRYCSHQTSPAVSSRTNEENELTHAGKLKDITNADNTEDVMGDPESSNNHNNIAIKSASLPKPNPKSRVIKAAKKKKKNAAPTYRETHPPNGKPQFSRREATLTLVNDVDESHRAKTIKDWIDKDYVPVRQTSLYKMIREYQSNVLKHEINVKKEEENVKEKQGDEEAVQSLKDAVVRLEEARQGLDIPENWNKRSGGFRVHVQKGVVNYDEHHQHVEERREPVEAVMENHAMMNEIEDECEYECACVESF